ncbi:amyloid-beta A4 precursor protein-binding family A member 3 isoform X6 [Camelus dromedarius]
MEFLTAPQLPPGPPAMDLEEPRDTLSASQDLTPDCQWDPAPGGPGSLSQMELDGPNIQDLVQQFKALPGDLVGLSLDGPPCPLHIATGHGLAPQDITDAHGLLSAEAGRDDLLSLLQQDECSPPQSCPTEPPDPAPRLLQPPEDPEGNAGPPEWAEGASAERGGSSSSSPEPWLETVPLVAPEEPPATAQSSETLASYPALREVSGPCDHEDLLDGVIFGAKYLGSTQLVSERNPPPSTRMAQAQEAMDRVKAPDGETQPMTEVDLFISTKRVKVLMADSQEALMDHALQTISYIADIGSVLVLMARRRLAQRPTPQAHSRRLYKMICHVFHSEDRGATPPHRPSSLLRPLARPSLWPTASSCRKAGWTPARWAPVSARGPQALATSTMGTSTTSPTAKTAGRFPSRNEGARLWAWPWWSQAGAPCCPRPSLPTCCTGAPPSARGPSASGTASPPSMGPAW